jgi:hypothetical protein
VRVIQASKESTIDSLRNLAPVLESLAKAGQDLPKSLQVFLTYPFIDEAVGRDPQVARNLHMGDFTNLSVSLSLDLLNLPNIPGLAPGVSLSDLLDKCDPTPLAPLCTQVRNTLSPDALKQVCTLVAALCAGTAGDGGGGLPNPLNLTGGSTTGSGVLGGLLGGLAPRPAPNDSYDPRAPQDPFLLSGTGYDPGLGTLLVQGVAYK